MKKSFFAIAIALFSFFSASAQKVDEEYRNLTSEYLKVSNTDATLNAIIPQMIESFKGMYTTVPASVWNTIEKKLTQAFSSKEIVDGMANIYVKYLSKKEMTDIINFFKSPSGKKLAASTPAITQDSYQWGQALGMKLGQEIVQELQKSGY